MVQFKTFEVERWMDTYETKTDYDLAETCALSIPLVQLLEWSKEDGEPPLEHSSAFTKKAGYGHITGSPRLRGNIAACYSASAGITSDNILVTQGAIGANFLAIMALVEKDDHVVVVSPAYQQLHELPRSFGAEVSLWQLKHEEQWQHRVKALEALLTKRTRLVIINNPNNPTGSAMSTEDLKAIHAAVKSHAAPDAMILSDEVYSPMWHSVQETPASMLDLGFDNVLVTGSVSKAYALAGLRVGWIATQNKALHARLAGIRDYNVISVSGVDDELATRALNPHAKKRVLERNLQLARTNRGILSEWIDHCAGEEQLDVRWVPTQGGNTALVYLGDGVDDVAFCRALAEDKKVNIVPAGLCFGQKGWVRIGYVGDTDVLRAGLNITKDLLKAWSKRA